MLTTLAAFQPNLDCATLAKLPFPMSDLATCRAIAASSPDAATRNIANYYCTDAWIAARVAARLGMVATWSRGNSNAAILLGEFGATTTLNAPARLVWLTAMRAAAEANGFAWSLWGLDDIMGFAQPRPIPARPVLNPDVLHALGLRP